MLPAVINMAGLIWFCFSPIGLCVVGVIEKRANGVCVSAFDNAVPLAAHLVFLVFFALARPSIPELKPLAAELCEQGAADIEPTLTVDIRVDYTQRCFDAFVGNRRVAGCWFLIAGLWSALVVLPDLGHKPLWGLSHGK